MASVTYSLDNFTEAISSSPLARKAVIAAEKVQPVPCVEDVSILFTLNDSNLFPS